MRRSISPTLLAIFLSSAFYGAPACLGQNNAGSVSGQEFLRAVERGEAAKVRELLRRDPSLATAIGKDGISAIMKAVYYRQKDVVDALLACGIKLNIFEAAATGQTGRIKMLLKKDPSLANAHAPDGFTPLGLATYFGQTEAVKALLAGGARVNVSSRKGMRVMPLHSATAGKQLEIVRLLLAHGADVNARQEGGYTPLHQAAASGQIELARLFIARGANVNAKTENGKTPLALALQANQLDIVDLLRKHGASQ